MPLQDFPGEVCTLKRSCPLMEYLEDNARWAIRNFSLIEQGIFMTSRHSWISLLLIAAALTSGCVEDHIYNEASTTTQALKGVSLPDPGDPTHPCDSDFPSCDNFCDPMVEDPGLPGTCCIGWNIASCTEAGIYSPGDQDNDGVLDPYDHCVFTPDPTNANNDADSWGDVCDNCPFVTNQDQNDWPDYDGIGNACDADDDNDGILDRDDLCPLLFNHYMSFEPDIDGDGIGNECDPDIDGDGLLNYLDNCPDHANPLQRDYDGDGLGNACDADLDGDSILNTQDNCPHVPNTSQTLSQRNTQIRYDGRTMRGGLACTHDRVQLERVRPRYGTTPAHFNSWDQHSVPASRTEKTLIARVSTPPASVTRHLVFMSAGQQNQQFSDDLTGQPANYENNFPIADASRTVNMQLSSLLKDLLVNGGDSSASKEALLDMGETYAAIAFNATFGWSMTHLRAVEDSFYDHLRNSVDMTRLETITLAGHSRGGCLVARLASRFREDYPHIPVMLELYDPVCMYDNIFGYSEFGIPSFAPPYHNPHQSNYFTIGTDIRAQLTPHASTGQDVSDLRVLNVSSGDGTVTAHAFTQWSDPDILTEGSHPWYERVWIDGIHEVADNQFDETYNLGYINYDRLGIEFYEESCTLIDCKL